MGAPVLMHYSSDCTPLITKKRVKVAGSAGFKAIGEGKTTQEYLVQQCSCRCYDALGRSQT
eukprot:4329710-Prorocentrum_lima.AAC.1